MCNGTRCHERRPGARSARLTIHSHPLPMRPVALGAIDTNPEEDAAKGSWPRISAGNLRQALEVEACNLASWHSRPVCSFLPSVLAPRQTAFRPMPSYQPTGQREQDGGDVTVATRNPGLTPLQHAPTIRYRIIYRRHEVGTALEKVAETLQDAADFTIHYEI